MYRVDIENKRLIGIPATSSGELNLLNLRERFDILEWISDTSTVRKEHTP